MLLISVFLASCAKPRRIKLPPVLEGWQQPTARKNTYVVQRNDTLYSIAWAFGLDHRYLAKINNLAPPYALHFKQRLHIATPKFTKQDKLANVHTNISYNIKADVTNLKAKTLTGWLWPTTGRVVANFTSKLGGSKGVDITGSQGQAIVASNNGKVVYSGEGIRSYGKLIIIKHSDDYLSAYAYNKVMLVHEGQTVTAGQKIATMGANDEGSTRLHFEIRIFGKPVNPLLYLPRKP